MGDSLVDRIIRHIETSGPLPLAEYMHWCMADRQAGYYRLHTAIGREGDFITAPEVSQMFGELIGVWVRLTWEQMGSPSPFNLVELGPGRGTLMKDLLRATGNAPGFSRAVNVHLVETGEPMAAAQQETLSGISGIAWHKALADIPDAPTILLANEFMDVLPVRQYVKSGNRWYERCISVMTPGKLDWCLGSGVLANADLPQGHEQEPQGSVYEVSSVRESYFSNVVERIAEAGGAALIIDYGYAGPAFGETLQALRAHEFADPLHDPGRCDLTAHVDFAALVAVASGTPRIRAHPLITQGQFLLSLGLLERAGKLGQDADEETRARLTREAERLALPNEMGSLFKVLAVSTQESLWPFDQTA